MNSILLKEEIEGFPEFIKETLDYTWICYLELKIKWIGKKKNERAVNILNGKTIIKINKKYYRPSEVNFLKADFNKAKKKLRWLPKTSFKTLVEIMVESEIKMLILKNR